VLGLGVVCDFLGVRVAAKKHLVVFKRGCVRMIELTHLTFVENRDTSHSSCRVLLFLSLQNITVVVASVLKIGSRVFN